MSGDIAVYSHTMPKSFAQSRSKLVFVTTNRIWGGSEELWVSTAKELSNRGYRIAVVAGPMPEVASRLAAICRLDDRPKKRSNRWWSRMTWTLKLACRFTQAIAGRGLGLVVISTGGCASLLAHTFAAMCILAGVKYVLISHRADDAHRISGWKRPLFLLTYGSAAACYFISQHTRRLTLSRLGGISCEATVVRNPFNVPWHDPSPWPDESRGMRLACVARLCIAEKGQDVLLRVLAQEKWRSRPLTVSFFGVGDDFGGLKRMVEELGLGSVTLKGFTNDVGAIWRDHHGLILPSRVEGLPLALIEAMLSERIFIVTDVGGNSEVIDDGVNGFLAEFADELSLDAAMERAWSQRHEWHRMGIRAGADIRRIIPANPVAQFADTLEALLPKSV